MSVVESVPSEMMGCMFEISASMFGDSKRPNEFKRLDMPLLVKS